MVQSQPLLTIAIPTYNRAASLRRSLGSIVQQVNGIEGGWGSIEVIVSDNCSTDETESVVKEVGGAFVRYTCNPSNLGMEGNFLSCFEQAKGQLVWTFSDDDLLIDGVLKKLLKLAVSSPCDLIYLKPKYIFGELETFSSSPVKFHFQQVTAESFALRANGVLSFLSAVVVNKNRYLSFQQNANLRRYAGTWLAHYEWIYTLLAFGQSFFIATRPVIRARTGATGGYDIFKVFGEYYLEIGKEKLLEQPRMQRDLKMAMLYFHIPGFIIRTRLNTFGKFQYNPQKIAEQVLLSYGDTWFYRIIICKMLFGGEGVLKTAYFYSKIHARVWMIFRRLSIICGAMFRAQSRAETSLRNEI